MPTAVISRKPEVPIATSTSGVQERQRTTMIVTMTTVIIVSLSAPPRSVKNCAKATF